jgi:hypothetical protein
MTINYDKRTFRSVSNSGSGEVDASTTFYYQQTEDIVSATYQGGSIRQGQLMAKADENGCLDMRYQHLNIHGELMTGRCKTVPELLPDGRLRLHETWQWTSGDLSAGQSIIEEV